MEPASLNSLADLPDVEAAERFLKNLSERHPREHARLISKPGLLLDVATLAAFSPFLTTALLQHPGYLWWLERRRAESGVRSREDVLESLGQFSMTNSELEPTAMLARFRRRELLRIYLRDIRRLATISEVTEEISNLADAILEFALRLVVREIDNRYGTPLQTDEHGRFTPAHFCIAALGKLGSRELNYSSDIDLLFLYSGEGTTSGTGSRGAATNREYFIKVAELVTQMVGGRSIDGAAYRVDLRLRPHGTLGPLAMSLKDIVAYYKTDARPWERQVLIRSRGCAGDTDLFKKFFRAVACEVFQVKQTVESALANVRMSKEKIDVEQRGKKGFDVKTGRGGIREIEFIAQALQLAHAGKDQWLRSSHTLISLARLAERQYITQAELSELSAAYDFLRRTEHILQMENGVQTHMVPDDLQKRDVLAKRMRFAMGVDLEPALKRHTANVSRIYTRVFGEEPPEPAAGEHTGRGDEETDRSLDHIAASLQKGGFDVPEDSEAWKVIENVTAVSPHFASVLAANPALASSLKDPAAHSGDTPDPLGSLEAAVSGTHSYRESLAALRRAWSPQLLNIAILDIYEEISTAESKRRQTMLAEASLSAALHVVRDELRRRYGREFGDAGLGVLALGKLGGKALDYDSDLDLVLVYDHPKELPERLSAVEFYSVMVELLVNALSSVTRDGHLYRVDLRLRPYGSKGLSSMPATGFIQYLRETAEVWELLAFVKLRAVCGDMPLASDIEREARTTIHSRAQEVGERSLRNETLRIRLALEKQRARVRRSGDIDIKYGAGGLLDVYFATRYLQLLHNVPDDEIDRSTTYVLNRLRDMGVLSADLHQDLDTGYAFLSRLDHAMRLAIGRTTRLPAGDKKAIGLLAARLGSPSVSALLEELTMQRLSIRNAFEAVVGN